MKINVRVGISDIQTPKIDNFDTEDGTTVAELLAKEKITSGHIFLNGIKPNNLILDPAKERLYKGDSLVIASARLTTIPSPRAIIAVCLKGGQFSCFENMADGRDTVDDLLAAMNLIAERCDVYLNKLNTSTVPPREKVRLGDCFIVHSKEIKIFVSIESKEGKTEDVIEVFLVSPNIKVDDLLKVLELDNRHYKVLIFKPIVGYHEISKHYQLCESDRIIVRKK